MFDLGMMELLVIGVVALIVVGPKDLPGLFRTVGNFVGKMKGMAREFQRSMDDAAKSSGMGDVMDGVKGATDGLKKATSFNPMDFNKDLGAMAKDKAKKAVTGDAPGYEHGAEMPEGETAAKTATKKTATKKTAVKNAAAKAPVKKPAAKTAVKKPAAKATAKAATKKPVAKTATKKASAKKPAAKKTAAKKDA